VPLLLFGGLCGCLVGYIFVQQINRATEEPPIAVHKQNKPDLKAPRQIKQVNNDRTVYPYSVIPGGVLSREELANRILNDRVVADHYAKFAVGKFKIVKSEETQLMHVAYRIRDKVFWTAKKLKIAKGETLITDGNNNFARTRCGNRVSAVPMEPVSETEEPSVEIFDNPVLAMVEEPELPTLPETRLDLRDIPISEPYIPVHRPPVLPYYYRPIFVIRPNHSVVPEPATLGLLSIGLIALITVRIARKK
jgi:hypothetical protein